MLELPLTPAILAMGGDEQWYDSDFLDEAQQQ
jgi:hypothetical protein